MFYVYFLVEECTTELGVVLDYFDDVGESFQDNGECFSDDIPVPLFDQLPRLLIIIREYIGGQQGHTLRGDGTQILIITNPTIKIIPPSQSVLLPNKSPNLFLINFPIFKYLLVEVVLGVVGQVYTYYLVILFY